MKKKKLLLIVSNLKQGGFQRVCARTANLLKKDFEVYVLVFDGSEAAYPLYGVELIDIDIKPKDSKLGKLGNVLKRARKVKAIKKERQIDITYSLGMSANLINVLSRTGDVIWSGMRSYVDLDTNTIDFVCKRSDCVICCAKILEEYFLERYPGLNTVTIYNPFDVEKIVEESQMEVPLTEKEKEFFSGKTQLIGAMGRDDDLKGYWHLLKAFSMMRNKEARLVIIGNGKFLRERKLIKELHLEDRVYLTGGKTNPFAYLKYADIYAMASVNEGFPNALVEALCLGKPVVIANCDTGPAEILTDDHRRVKDLDKIEVGEYGILTPAMNTHPNYTYDSIEYGEDIFAEAVADLLENEELCKKYRAKAAERAKCFGTEMYAELFRKLAGIE